MGALVSLGSTLGKSTVPLLCEGGAGSELGFGDGSTGMGGKEGNDCRPVGPSARGSKQDVALSKVSAGAWVSAT